MCANFAGKLAKMFYEDLKNGAEICRSMTMCKGWMPPPESSLTVYGQIPHDPRYTSVIPSGVALYGVMQDFFQPR